MGSRQIETAFKIMAAAPDDRNSRVPIALETSLLMEVKSLGAASILGQGVGLVLGGKGGKSVLESPCALFRGLNRPLECATLRAWHQDEKAAREWYCADRMHIYVSNPECDWCASGSGNLTQVCPPDHSVFVTYVRIWDSRDGQPSFYDPRSGTSFVPQGLVVWWEWVVKSPDGRDLPELEQARYSTRVY